MAGISRGQHGSESVWDYPRPPRLESSGRHLKIVHAGRVLAETTESLRILETSHPPVYYIPQSDIAMEYMVPSRREPSFCEFKGFAEYWNIEMLPERGRLAVRVRDAAWSYAEPTGIYSGMAGYLAFYASRVDECYIDEERVQPQPGDFYGGWITSHVRGPFKGSPGTLGW